MVQPENAKGGGEYHFTIDLLFGLFGLVCFANNYKNCRLSYSWFQTSQTGGQWYSDTSPLVFPGTAKTTMREINAYRFSKLLTPSAKGSRWTQTLDLMMTWQVIYHCATTVGQIKNLYRILLSIMRLQVKCTPEFHIDFGKKIFLFFKNNFKSNNHCKLNHNKSYLKPFVSYLLCIVCRE